MYENDDFQSREKIFQKKERQYRRKEDENLESKFFQEFTPVELEKKGLIEGRVVALRGGGIIVHAHNEHFTCSLRGVIKKQRQAFKNLVVVGDRVFFSELPDKEGLIHAIAPRKGVLSRADNLSRNKQQFIASNIDQVFIVASVVMPHFKPSLVDRYLIAAKKGGIEGVVVINKIDLLNHGSEDESFVMFEEVVSTYSSLGISYVLTTIQTPEGVDSLIEKMKGRTSVFSGQSGVGKSSLVNKITGSRLQTSDVVERTNKGAHTTTAATLIPLSFGGWCVDTPGIKSFGIWELEKSDLKDHFSEIAQHSLECRFPSCTHTHEPDCAVQRAVEDNRIASFRFQSYCTLLNELETQHKKR